MHKSCMVRVEWIFEKYKSFFPVSSDGYTHILDVGGGNINGELHFEPQYLVDSLNVEQISGSNICVKDPYCWTEIQDCKYDVVLSLNTFQHIEYFWLTLNEIKRVLKEDGIFIMCAPSNRYDGKYPVACWAINIDGLYAIAKYIGLEVMDASVAGIPCEYVGEEWNSPHDDALLIAKKGRILNFEYPRLNIARRCKNTRKAILLDWLNLAIDKPNFLKEYMDKKEMTQIYVFGAGKIGQLLVKTLGKEYIVSIIDNYKTGKINDIEIKKIDSTIDKKYPIIVSVIQEFDITSKIVQELKENGFQKIINVVDLINDVKECN